MREPMLSPATMSKHRFSGKSSAKQNRHRPGSGAALMDDELTMLLVDDHALVRESMARWFGDMPGVTVVGSCAVGVEAIEQATACKPDIVLMDVDIPGLLACDAARTIIARLPETRVVFVSANTHDRCIEGAIRSGASGFVSKDEDPANITDAISAIVSGKYWFSPSIRERIVFDTDGPRLAPNGTDHKSLTPREREVLRLVASGLTKKQIGEQMRISVKTVDNHCTSFMAKLNIHDRVEVARYAIREGIIEP